MWVTFICQFDCLGDWYVEMSLSPFLQRHMMKPLSSLLWCCMRLSNAFSAFLSLYVRPKSLCLRVRVCPWHSRWGNSDDTLGCCSVSSTLLDARSLIWPCGCQASCCVSFLEFSCPPHPCHFTVGVLGLQIMCYHAQSVMDSRHPDSDPQTYINV